MSAPSRSAAIAAVSPHAASGPRRPMIDTLVPSARSAATSRCPMNPDAPAITTCCAMQSLPRPDLIGERSGVLVQPTEQRILEPQFDALLSRGIVEAFEQ